MSLNSEATQTASVMDSWWFRFDTTKPRCLQNIVFCQKTLLGGFKGIRISFKWLPRKRNKDLI
ncbi:unnamed protein product [Brassica rapa subsp. trilocularis]